LASFFCLRRIAILETESEQLQLCGLLVAKQVKLYDVIFEFIPRGNSVKVSAVDPISGHEVAIVGDPNTGEEYLKRVAQRKLEYVLTKMLNEEDEKDQWEGL